MNQKLPPPPREYSQHPMLDSTRWRVYRHRPGDIVISTSYKTGTTWTQTIVANLLYQDGRFPASVGDMSPWVDMALPPLDEMAQGLEAQTGRRFIKTHLPLDGMPYFETARYIVVGRDARDVFMSLWNHHTSYTDFLRGYTQNWAAAAGVEFPLDFSDIHEFWRLWINKSWYDWESSGYPYWSHFHHVQSWWDYRHLPNVLFVHFADLLEDPEKQIRRIAGHIGVAIDEEQLPGILQRISFGGMKESFHTAIMPMAPDLFRGGAQTFMNKGTNGRWRDVLTEEELAEWQAAVNREVTPDCAEWLEHGGGSRTEVAGAAAN